MIGPEPEKKYCNEDQPANGFAPGGRDRLNQQHGHQPEPERGNKKPDAEVEVELEAGAEAVAD